MKPAQCIATTETCYLFSLNYLGNGICAMSALRRTSVPSNMLGRTHGDATPSLQHARLARPTKIYFTHLLRNGSRRQWAAFSVTCCCRLSGRWWYLLHLDFTGNHHPASFLVDALTASTVIFSLPTSISQQRACRHSSSRAITLGLSLCTCLFHSLPTMRVLAARLGGFVQKRGFASTSSRLDNYAFVGLGQMVWQCSFTICMRLGRVRLCDGS